MLDIRERRDNPDGSTVYLIYQGRTKDGSDNHEEAIGKIKVYLSKPYLCKKIKRSVCILRTILRDYDEDYLYLKYEDDDVIKYIQYQNNELLCFEKKYKKSKNSIKYTKRKDVHFDMRDADTMEEDEFQEISKSFDKLRNIGPFKIDDASKLLVEVYRIFFKTDPCFTENNINDRVQCMMYLLKEYGIVFPEFSDIGTHDDTPISVNLERLVYHLFPYGSITEKFESQLDEKQKKVIRIVGRNVCDAVKNYRNPTEALVLICSMMELQKRGKSTKELDIHGYSRDTLKETVKSLKKINKKESDD